MATSIQRASAALQAISDRDIGQATMLRVARAFWTLHGDAEQEEPPPAEMAGVVLAELQTFVRGVVEQAEVRREMESARQAALESARQFGRDEL